MEWPAQLNPSSWVLSHLQETDKNTYLPSSFDPLILELSILILFYLLVFFLFKKEEKKNTWPSNTCTLYSILIRKKPITLAFSILSTCLLFIYYKKWPSNTSILYTFDLFYLFKKNTIMSLQYNQLLSFIFYFSRIAFLFIIFSATFIQHRYVFTFSSSKKINTKKWIKSYI